MTPLVKQADFRRLWIGQAISEVGSRITRDGVPYAALLLLDATPSQMSFLTATGAFSVLMVSPLAGVLCDRMRRKPVLIVTDVLRALVIAAIPLAALLGVLNFQQLYIVAALSSALTVFFQVAYQSWLPFLVHRNHLVEANSKMTLASSIAEVCGPGLAGILVTALTAPVAILLDAISFLWSAACIALIRKEEPQPKPQAQPGFIAEVREGFQTVRSNRVLSILAARAMTQYFAFGFLAPLYSLFALRELGLTPLLLGFVITAGGVSNLIGAVAAPWAVKRFGVGRTLRIAAIGFAAAACFIPLSRGPVALATFSMVLGQLGDCFWVLGSVPEISLRQSIVEDRLLGRVNSVMQVATQGIWPIGALIAGFAAEYIGVRNTLWIGCSGLALSSLWLFDSSIGALKTLRLDSDND